MEIPIKAKHISLLEQINEDEEQSSLMYAIIEAAPELERKHLVCITDSALCWATYLTHRHFSQTLSGPALEEMAIDVVNSGCLLLKSEINGEADKKRMDELDYILSRCIVESLEMTRDLDPEYIQHMTPLLEKEFIEASSQLTKFITTWKPMLIRSVDIQEQLALRTRVSLLRTFISSICMLKGKLSDSSYNILLQKFDVVTAKIEEVHVALDRCHIGKVVSGLIGVPLPVLPTYGSSELLSLSDRLRERVVGQDGAINDIYKSIFTNSSLHNNMENRPRASLLFLGPSGVGKTEAVECITRVFFSSLDRLIRVDMSKYEEYGLQWLAETISEKPYSLILFDKIERSHLDAMGKDLLDIVCGKLISDKDGHHVNLSNVIVIMTSIVGTDHESLASLSTCSNIAASPDSVVHRMRECCLKTSTKDHALEEARTIFSPDLLNALDGTIVFDSFGHGIENVTRHILREMVQTMSANKLIVYPSNHVLDVVSSDYFKQPGKGAKAIKSWVEENLMPQLRGIVEKMAKKHCRPCTVYVDTLIGTEELSFRLDETDFTELWMVKHHKQSFRTFISLYQLENRVLELKNSLFSSEKSDQKHFLDAAIHIEDIFDQILQPRWLLDEDEAENVLYSVVPGFPISSHLYTERERCCRHYRYLKERLLQQQSKETIQNQAVDLIIAAVLESIDSSFDHHSYRCPRSFLLMGLTSFGRTELVKNLMDHFEISNEEKSLLVTVDFSNEDDNSQSKLFSFSRSGENYASPILEAVRSCPYTVLVFDQIEKANASVFGTLLKIIDTGFLNDIGQKSVVNFRNTTIVVTTNLGNKDRISKLFGCSNPSRFEETDHATEGVKRFRAELIYRTDEIVLFDPRAKLQTNIIRFPLKKVGVFLRKTRQSVYSLFKDYAAMSDHDHEKGHEILSSLFNNLCVTNETDK